MLVVLTVSGCLPTTAKTPQVPLDYEPYRAKPRFGQQHSAPSPGKVDRQLRELGEQLRDLQESVRP